MIVANEVIPYFEPGGNFTGQAQEAITGRRLVKVDASVDPGWQPEGLQATGDPNVVPILMCDAGEVALGVAQKDVAEDKLVTVMGVPGAIYPMTSAGAIDPGDPVRSAADGKVAAGGTGGGVCGVAMSKAEGADALVAVKFLPSAA